MSFYRRLKKSLVFTFTSIFLSLKEKTDVILCSSGPITVGLVGIVKSFFDKKVKFVFEIRDLWPDGLVEMGILKNKVLVWLAYKFEEICYKYSDLVVAASIGQMDNILSRFKIENHLIIPNACDFNLFKRNVINIPSWANSKKVFIHAGSIGLMNNCEQIINAARIIKKNGWDTNLIIVFIGDGVDKSRLENLAIKENLEFVFFLNLMPKIDLVSWLNFSTASILTASNHRIMDTLSPNKLFDSFAAKTPIIQTTKGWIHELVIKYKCGINVNSNNPFELAEAIRFLAFNSELSKKYGLNAYNMAKEQFDREKLANIYIDKIFKLFPFNKKQV
jgi:glycosyltransferase involved in cell wall biosynthesis